MRRRQEEKERIRQWEEITRGWERRERRRQEEEERIRQDERRRQTEEDHT